MFTDHAFHLASTGVLLLIARGLYLRHRNRVAHARAMLAAFCIDVLLVVYIEVARGAVETVAGSTDPIVLFHAAVSIVVLGLYVALVLLGRKVLHGEARLTTAHRNCGMAFVVLRTANYVTAFLV